MKPVFYYVAAANCCERVRWALDYKQFDYTLVELEVEPDASANANHDAARFAALSPFGRVPLMEIDGQPLSESMAMLEWLEEVAPTPALTYTSAFARARVREACEAVNASIHPVQNSSVVAYFQPDWSKAQMRPVRAHWIGSNLAKLQSRLWQESGFAVGGQFTMADILLAVMYRKGVALGMLPDAYPAYEAHWQLLMAQEAIRASCPPSMRA